jgi:hypothetical protein
MASVFHDTLQADVEQTHRVTQTIRQLPREAAAGLAYRQVDVLSIQPSGSLDALAQQHLKELPAGTRNALAALGMLRGGGGALVSYLLFEPPVTQALLALGDADTMARRDEVLQFFLIVVGFAPLAMRWATRSSPCCSASLSSRVSTPASPSASAHAFERRTSCGQRRKSVPMERLIASSSGDGPPANRPPHSLWVPASEVLTAYSRQGSKE